MQKSLRGVGSLISLIIYEDCLTTSCAQSKSMVESAGTVSLEMEAEKSVLVTANRRN